MIMAEYAYFYDSENGDRTYNADSFSNWLKKFFTTGVFQNELQVVSSGGMNVKVGEGYSNIEGKVKFFGETEFTISPASSSLPRIDTVVVERNDVDRDFSLKVITGQYSGENPQPTPPVRENEVYQLVLAQIYVAAGAVSISGVNITDTRPNSELCGWVVGTVNEINLSQILQQSTQEFYEWFATIQDVLDEDTAGHLQNEIDEIRAVTINVTLDANNWFNDEYIITNPQLRGTDTIKQITYPSSMTDAQFEAFNDMGIRHTGESEGSITIKAMNGAPSINIPIQIVVSK